MFATQVEEWKSEARIGSQAVGDGSSFEGSHPLQEQITQIQEIIAAHPGLRAGSQEVLIASGGLFIVNRTLASKNYLVGFNGRDADQSIDLNSLGIKQGWRLLDGGCSIDATDSTRCTLSGRSYFVIENGTSAVNTPALANLKVNAKRTSLPTGWIEISTRVPGKDFVEVSFSVRSPGKAWRHLGTSDRRTFSTDKTRGGLHRVFLHPEKFKKGSTLEIIAVVKSGDNKIKASAISKVKL
jgi:hypothetical protein